MAWLHLHNQAARERANALRRSHSQDPQVWRHSKVFFNAAVAVTSSLKYIFIRHIFDSHFWEFVVSQKYEINLFSENFDFTQFCASALCNKLVFKNIE